MTERRQRSKLLILMACYNGANFIGEQIESIRQQTFKDWKLLIRDDGSSDRTVAIVNEHCYLDNRIEILSASQTPLGPAGNFGALLLEARQRGADYIALSDQDDVWKENKLEDQLAFIRTHERSGLKPLLVHTDLLVADEALNTISPSFMRFQHIKHPSKEPLKTLLAQNVVTGCTILANRELLEIALPIPEQVIDHDWWLALAAASTGELLFMPSQTVVYRQHQHNAVGAKGLMGSANPLRANFIALIKKHRQKLHAQLTTIEILLTRITAAGIRDENATTLLGSYHSIMGSNTPRIFKLIKLMGLGIRAQNFPRQILFTLLAVS